MGRARARLDAVPEAQPGADRPVRTAVHDIRNSLATVKMAIQTLAIGESVSDRGKRRLEIALREVDAIDRLLDRLAEVALPSGEPANGA